MVSNGPAYLTNNNEAFIIGLEYNVLYVSNGVTKYYFQALNMSTWHHVLVSYRADTIFYYDWIYPDLTAFIDGVKCPQIYNATFNTDSTCFRVGKSCGVDGTVGSAYIDRFRYFWEFFIVLPVSEPLFIDVNSFYRVIWMIFFLK